MPRPLFGKPAIQSRTLWGGGLILVSTLAQWAGYELPVPVLETSLNTLIDLAGVGLTIWGRLRADLPIRGLLR
jgi:hypothetical protein